MRFYSDYHGDDMSKKDIKLKVYNPRGRIERAPRFPASPRLKSINNKKIGVLKFGVWV
jgi:hypothetical protein